MARSGSDFGIVGLGRMGGNLLLQALERGYRVAGYRRNRRPRPKPGFTPLPDVSALRTALRSPRIVFLYIPAGRAVDEVLAQLELALERDDIVLDGGNSYWGDSIRRAQRLAAKGIQLLDLGTSGGTTGARNGACFMVGGPRAAVARVAPILKRLAVPGGYVHAGPSGAGHFVKLVHNGVEFGMLQALGEGLDLLERAPFDLPVADVLSCWRNGSVIRSWLVDLLHERYRDDALAGVPALVEDTGEVNWLVADAFRLEVPVPAIALAAMQLVASRDASQHWARAIAMMRRGFGGHPYGASKKLQHKRRTSRVGMFARPS